MYTVHVIATTSCKIHKLYSQKRQLQWREQQSVLEGLFEMNEPNPRKRCIIQGVTLKRKEKHFHNHFY